MVEINYQLDQEGKVLLEKIKELTEIASPTGNTVEIMQNIMDKLDQKNIQYKLTPKGGLMITLPGQNQERQRFLTAHVDTLGAMVRAIKPDGRLKLDLIGGFKFNAVEGTYCQIHSASSGKVFDGTILMHQTSVHVYRDVDTAERNQTNMEIRIDYPVFSAEDVEKLGIKVGDFISFAPRAEITESGYIKSRHLDDKVSVVLLMEAIERIVAGDLPLAHTTHFYISNNEEIGYGGNSNIADEVEEYIAVDMGALGDDQTSDEYTVSICAKDASGPYHLGLRNLLVTLCEEKNIPYKVDIYPYYGSDASAAMRAGADVRHGLFGAGIDASHAYERTHITSVIATKDLIETYLETPMK
ncbi:M42 family metallopeptidase [Facklamia sp. DSM 111018]|uniref:M42 family metallopeptidase n=1 Tax=Facklamia lactis TaxID=2749967 RepID=A0ABS0LTV8_9LACT|nr:M42 family metallopeptidase [Facklamia lactis]MBG9980903.1 M42 family metallopeptidase [Facklamia lactis]MBG9986734.1 M42 family metallopeptidase [Facklamia lactis]